MTPGWALLLIVIVVGLLGTVLGERYVAEFSALLLIGLALGLRRLTWGTGRDGDED